MDNLDTAYTAFHATHVAGHVYPPEWLVRTLLGQYPDLMFGRPAYVGSHILDVGFGDGRCWPLLRNLGFNVSGVEITAEIVALGRSRAEQLEMTVDLRVGRNAEIPFPTGQFEFLLASNSCYYVDAGRTFDETLQEYARVLGGGGYLLATLPESSGQICEGGVDLGNGHIKITRDPWGLRNGYIFRSFESKDDVRRTLAPFFETLGLGLCRDEYFGIRISYFIAVCRRR